MAAPIASHGGAVVEDAELLRYAEAVIAASGQGDIEQGLTKAQITERVLRIEDLDPIQLDGIGTESFADGWDLTSGLRRARRQGRGRRCSPRPG